MAEPIVITGAGIVSAIGIGKAETVASLRDGRTGIISAPRYLRTVHRDYPVGEVPLSNDELKRRLGIDSEPTNRTALLGMLAIEEALQQAHLLPLTSNLLPLINGTTVGGMDRTEDYYDEYLSGGPHGHYVGIHDCGSTTELMARHFGCFSWSTSVSTACSSALNAIIFGANLIRSGQTEMAVVGGSECLTRFHLNGFRSLMILDHELCRPFEDNRAGLNLGEGAAFLVIETLSSAKRRNATLLGYICGYGNACDAFHQTATSDDGEGPFLAMQKALSMAQISPGDVTEVHAHGTGTPNNDATELRALQRVFGTSVPKVLATKRLTGHTTSAAGSVSAVIALLGLQPGSCAMVNAFGFGGNDSSLILSHEPHEPYEPHESYKPHKPIFVKADGGISASADPDFRQWLSPLESRRMGKLLKRALVTAEQAMQQSGITCPDAIISATHYGCIDNTEKFLHQLCTAGEEQPLSPTCFMQSTHNTISSMIASRHHCHGYNTTYSHGSDSFQAALTDACLQLRLGDISSALITVNDEMTPTWADALRHAGIEPPLAASRVLMLTTDPTNALYQIG